MVSDEEILRGMSQGETWAVLWDNDRSTLKRLVDKGLVRECGTDRYQLTAGGRAYAERFNADALGHAFLTYSQRELLRQMAVRPEVAWLPARDHVQTIGRLVDKGLVECVASQTFPCPVKLTDKGALVAKEIARGTFKQGPAISKDTHTVVIYHADCVDGFTAAWCAWRALGDEGVEYIPAHYGDRHPIVDGKFVFVLDFSYPREVLLAMHEQAGSLLVLDHHKTAQADLDGLSFCRFDMEKSGAMLAWEHFAQDSDEKDHPPPLVRYVEDRDLWRWSLRHSKEISAYIATIGMNFHAWSQLSCQLKLEFHQSVMMGDTALRVIEKYVSSKRKNAHNVVCAGYDVPIVNTAFAVSALVGALAEGEHFAIGWFSPGPGEYVYSLRSRGDGVDVSEVAKRFGGGGHRGAAGFKSDKSPEVLFAWKRGTAESGHA